MIDLSVYTYIKKYIDKVENPIIFELGCHWGEDTERLLSYSNNKKSKLVCVEPDTRNIQVIKSKNLKRLNPNCDIELVEGAISNKLGTTELYLSDGIHTRSGNIMTGANSIRKPKEVLTKHKWITFNKSIQVETYTIDYLCGKHHIDNIDFIWSDIQGCEYDMIQGAKKMIDNIGLMLLEYSDLELYEGQKKLKDILDLLGSNWELLIKTDCDILVKNKQYESNNG